MYVVLGTDVGVLPMLALRLEATPALPGGNGRCSIGEVGDAALVSFSISGLPASTLGDALVRRMVGSGIGVDGSSTELDGEVASRAFPNEILKADRSGGGTQRGYTSSFS